MIQSRSEPLILDYTQTKWKRAVSAPTIFNFIFRNFLPSVDLDSFNEVYFGGSSKNEDGNLILSRKDFYVVEEKSSGLQISLPPAADVMSGSRSRRIVECMMRSENLEETHGVKPAVDIPLSSTSGRVDREFWKQRGRARNSFMYEPLGTLYNIPGEDFVTNQWDIPCGKSLEESIPINQNHAVSTTFKQGKDVDDRSVWLSSSHKVGCNHELATHYGNDLHGGNNFNVKTSHQIIRDSILSSNLHTNFYGECSLQLELQREKQQGNQEVSESIMTNLRTGEKVLKLQSRNIVKDIVLTNSLVSNLRQEHALQFLAMIPLWRSSFVSSRLSVDSFGSHELCINTMQKIHGQFMVGGSFSTDWKQDACFSVESNYELDEFRNLELKLTNDCQGRRPLDVTASVVTKRNNLIWGYRNAPAQSWSSSFEWKHQVSEEQFLSVRATGAGYGCTLYTEMSTQW